jgi:hypothetical protein
MLKSTCVVLMIVWSFGLPAFLFFSMYRVRVLIADDDEDTLAKFDFVLGDYKKTHWYWEVVELSRKLILSGLIGLFGRGTVAQVSVATLTSFVYFAFNFREAPFEESRMNFVKVTSEFQIFGILLICIILQTKEANFAMESISIDGYGYTQIALTVCILPVTIYCSYLGMMDFKKEVFDEQARRESLILLILTREQCPTFKPDAKSPTYENNLVDIQLIRELTADGEPVEKPDEESELEEMTTRDLMHICEEYGYDSMQIENAVDDAPELEHKKQEAAKLAAVVQKKQEKSERAAEKKRGRMERATPGKYANPLLQQEIENPLDEEFENPLDED